MGDSGYGSDQGLQNNQPRGRGRNRGHRALPYMEQYFTCLNCRAVLYSTRMYIIRETHCTWFDIDVTVVVFDNDHSLWRCRNCNTTLSTGIPAATIIRGWNQRLCIISHNDTARNYVNLLMLA